jgi:hypothetical protein
MERKPMEGTEEDRLKELKVTIPAELHLELVRRKLLKGQTIAATVQDALREYFDEHELASKTEPLYVLGDHGRDHGADHGP